MLPITQFTRGNLGLGVFAIAATGLVAAAIFSLLTTQPLLPTASMTIKPLNKTLLIGEILPVEIVVSSPKPSNAFTGELIFSNDTFVVEKIDYNTALADLWVTEPWYSKADNTIYFAGGTTRPGGFVGTETLLTVYLRSTQSGEATLALENAQLLAHDGFGTTLPLPESVDALFTSEALATQSEIIAQTTKTQNYTIIENPPSFDLNNDGVIGLADVGILLLKLGSTDMRFDLNLDGFVNQTDITTLLSRRNKN